MILLVFRHGIARYAVWPAIPHIVPSHTSHRPGPNLKTSMDAQAYLDLKNYRKLIPRGIYPRGIFHIKIIKFCTKTTKIQKTSASRRDPYPESKKSKTPKRYRKHPRNVPQKGLFDTFRHYLIILQLPWLTLKFNPSKKYDSYQIMTVSIKKLLM